MKSSFFKILLISLFSFSFLAGTCSSDDDDDSGEEIIFTPITLNFNNIELETSDTNFSLNGYDFEVVRAVSEISEPPVNGGIGLAYPENSNPSTLELNLSNTNGLSKITIEMFNNCGGGCTIIQTLNDNEILQELNDNLTIPTGDSIATINDVNSSITSLRIS